jgi:hypothetical protein
VAAEIVATRSPSNAFVTSKVRSVRTHDPPINSPCGSVVSDGDGEPGGRGATEPPLRVDTIIVSGTR